MKINTADIIGKKIARLTIIVDHGRINNKRIIEAKCECGNIKKYNLYNIFSGSTKSCGCLQLELAAIAGIKHNLTKHPLHLVWRMMRQRCYNINATNYFDYGGRGIKICKEWLNDFECFYKWAISNGWVRGMQIDRIDNNENYTPKNCRIVTKKINSRNRRTSLVFEVNGQSKPLGEWCEIYNIPYNNVNSRLRKGWSIIKALTTKILN